ncbi:MAG: hypothetical protein ACE5IB_01595 [Candidatus Geothermarchaeales archaeon]
MKNWMYAVLAIGLVFSSILLVALAYEADTAPTPQTTYPGETWGRSVRIEMRMWIGPDPERQPFLVSEEFVASIPELAEAVRAAEVLREEYLAWCKSLGAENCEFGVPAPSVPPPNDLYAARIPEEVAEIVMAAIPMEGPQIWTATVEDHPSAPEPYTVVTNRYYAYLRIGGSYYSLDLVFIVRSPVGQ